MNLLDPPFAQDAVALAADLVHATTMLMLAAAAPVIAGMALFSVFYLWGPR